MYFLYSLSVVAPMQRSWPARERGLQHIGRVDRTFACTGPDERMQLVDEADDLAIRLFNLAQNCLQALLELAAKLGARDHGRQVEGHKALVLQCFGNVALVDSLRQPLGDGRLAHARLADQHGVVLGAPREHLDDAPDFLVAADDGVELALPGLRGQIKRVPLQRLVLVLGIRVRDALGTANRRQCP